MARDVFLDPAKLHELNHAGEHFKVAGPLNLSRSPQGQPVIFQAGVSDEGRDLAARVAEGIYAPGGSLEQAQEYYADIKRRTASYGRNPDHIKVFIHGGPIGGATDEAARRREREIFEEDNGFERNLALLGRSFGAYDFSGHDLDAPTDEVQRPWADAYLAAWDQPRRPRIGLSRFVFPAKDRRTALQQIGDDVHRAALRMAQSGAFPEGLGRDEALRRFHSFHGAPEEIVAALVQEKVLPLATDLITQFNPAVPDHDAAIRALELIATEVAPALGWRPATEPEPQSAGV